MVAFTPSGLPYQTGADAPCDYDQVWQAFAEAVDDRLEAQLPSLSRLSPAIPMAKIVRTSTLPVVQPAVLVPFEFVEYDTDGMADLSYTAFQINPQRTGMWAIQATVQHDAVGSNVNEISCDISYGNVRIGPDLFTFAWTKAAEDESRWMNADAPWTQRVFGTHKVTTILPFGYGVALYPHAVSGLTVSRVELSAYWLGDLQ